MPLTAEQLPTLETYLQDDPDGALAAFLPIDENSNFSQIAGILNDPAHPLASGIVDRDRIFLADIRAGIRVADWKTLQAPEQSYLQFCVAGDGDFPVNQVFKDDWTRRIDIGGQWGPNAVDAPENILALIEFIGSAIEVLFGEGASAFPAEIAAAIA